MNNPPRANFSKRTHSHNSDAKGIHLKNSSQPKNAEVGKSVINSPNSFEEYRKLAQAAMGQGDRVLAETYYQYAEHLLRVTNEGKEDSSTCEPVETKLSQKSKPIQTRSFESPLEKELAACCM